VTDVPRLEAEVLFTHVTGLSRVTLLAHPDRPLPTNQQTNQQTNYQALVRRRASGYPLPYLTGHIEFYGLEFEVTPETLIPRPETETLVDLALASHSSSTHLLIADVGAGCGCITVALAAHLPNATVYAIEIAPPALAVARRNVERHGLTARVRMVAGDTLTPLSGPVHLIVSNPPYVSTGDCASLPVSVRDHEPRLALDGGPDGLSVIRRLLAQAPAKLHPGGRLLIEIGADQGEAVTSLARTFFPRATIRVHPDLAGRDRVLEVQT
jgi:release factor glutamine methyltransferase